MTMDVSIQNDKPKRASVEYLVHEIFHDFFSSENGDLPFSGTKEHSHTEVIQLFWKYWVLTLNKLKFKRKKSNTCFLETSFRYCSKNWFLDQIHNFLIISELFSFLANRKLRNCCSRD